MSIESVGNSPRPSGQTGACDREDMARLVSGHTGALDDLMARHGPKLLRYLVRSLQNEEEADDLAQETFVRVYQNRASFNPGQRFSTWLYTIASNLVRDRFRYRSRHPQVSLDAEQDTTNQGFIQSFAEPGPTPVERIEANERFGMIRAAVQELPEELRLALILFEYEELSHAEIAAALNCSTKAVETRLYRARQQLRSNLSRVLDGAA